MFYWRLLAGISFLGFTLALAGTLRLAAAKGSSPMEIGNARYFEDLAERNPALAGEALREAVRLNPRDSAAWMALGLAMERDGDMEQAGGFFLEAEKIDRQYLPAWTSANFFFRCANFGQFWRAARRAAALSYDDPAPLIELADHLEPDALAGLDRLGDSAHLERGYLRMLMAQSRWREAQHMAARLSLRGATSDRELLFYFTDRLLQANEGDAALAAWNALHQFPAPDRASRGTLVNQNFEREPSGHGFDWRVTGPPQGLGHWQPSRLDFWLAGSTPDTCRLLEQWVMLDAGRYRLRFTYRTEGLAEVTGLRWTLLQGDRAKASSPILSAESQQLSNGNVAEWNVRVARTGLYELSWIYSRASGTIHQEGRVSLAFASLEMR